MSWTDDPVRDAEQYARMQEKHSELHRVGRCAQCGEDIHDYDDYYDFEGDIVHDECVLDWIVQFKK